MNQSNVYLEGDTLVVKDGKSHIVFSPFQVNITRVNSNPREDAVLHQQLRHLGFFQEPPGTLKKKEKWEGFSSITLFLTRGCNLGCIYCYASARPYAPEMSIQTDFALKATDWFLRQLKKDLIRLTFHGGGEPTLEQKTIKTIFDHIEACKGGKEAKYIITSNGTAPRPFLDWMMERKFGISISMDGPPDIQDRNRPFVNGAGSSGIVESTVRYLSDKQYPFSIRMTYSAGDDLERTLRYFASLGVNLLHLEPLFPHGREYATCSTDSDVSPPKGKELLDGFVKAMGLAKELGIKLFNGHLASFTRGTSYFCAAASGRAMMVTHDGFLSGCIEVTDSADEHAGTFILGKWNEATNEFIVDERKIRWMLTRHSDGALTECKDCYARFICAGGCAVKALKATGDFFERDHQYCAFTRAITPMLIKRIAVESGV